MDMRLLIFENVWPIYAHLGIGDARNVKLMDGARIQLKAHLAKWGKPASVKIAIGQVVDFIEEVIGAEPNKP